MTAGVAAPPHQRAGAVETALESLRAGRPVLLVDDGRCEVVLAAALADAPWVAWTVRHTSGLLCAALRDDRADRLELPLMVPQATDRPAYTVSADASSGIGTGISAADRARAARIFAEPDSVPGDLRRPGHLLGLRVDPDSVSRRGYGEAAVDLCGLAGLPPVGLTATLVADPTQPDVTGDLADAAHATALAQRYDVPTLTMSDLAGHPSIYSGLVRKGAREVVSTPHGRFAAITYHDAETEHLALVGMNTPPARPRVAVHVECTAGDLFGSSDCACRSRLDRSLAEVARHGGVVVYLRPLGASGHHGLAEPSLAPVAAAILAELGMPNAGS